MGTCLMLQTPKNLYQAYVVDGKLAHKYLFFSTTGFLIFPNASKNYHHHGHCCPFQFFYAYNLIPTHLCKTALLWFDVKTHREAGTTNIIKFIF